MTGNSPVLPVLLGLPLAGTLAAAVLPERWSRRLGVAVTGAVLVWTLGLVAAFHYGRTGPQFGVDTSWVPAIDVRFHLGVDGISLPLIVLTALLSFLCAVYTLGHLPEPGQPRTFTALLLLLEVGVLGTFTALDLLLFFVAFEVVLIPMYALIAGWGGAGRRGAATKFLLYTLLGSGVLLLGLLGIYAATGTFDMTVLAAAGGAGISRRAQDLCFLALLIGFGVKSPVWPLHTWLPDAHTEAPTVGSVLLAGVLLKLGTYGLIRIAVPVLPSGARDLAPALAVLAVVGILYGALCCLAQHDVKRLVAYSSVGHMGFVLLGISTLTPLGIDAALLGNVAHGVVTGLLFFLVGSLKERYHSQQLAELGGGVLAKLPVLGGLLLFVCVASLGLPGLAGFWGEILAITSAYSPGPGLSVPLYRTLMVLAAAGTLLTAVYFLVLLRRLLFGVVPDRWRTVRFAGLAASELAAWSPLLALTVAVGLYPRLVLGVSDAAVRSLLAGR